MKTTLPPLRAARVTGPDQAAQVTAFLLQPGLFGTPATPGEREEFISGPGASIDQIRHAYWFIRDRQGQVCGVLGIRMHHFQSGIYEITALAIAAGQRRLGFGRGLLQIALDYIAEAQGRGLIFDTSSNPAYQPVQHLLEHLGFTQVGRFPDFYAPGEDTLWYYRPI